MKLEKFCPLAVTREEMRTARAGKAIYKGNNFMTPKIK